MPGPYDAPVVSGGEPVIEALDDVWSSIVRATDGMGEAEWDLPTDCPGWSVRDHLSHLIGIERTLLGDPQPPAPATRGPHVRNDIGAMNEAWVEQRRGRPGDEVRAEWRDVADRRLRALAALGPEEWERIGPSPIGQVPYRRFMWLRVMDSWVHEQDIRGALGRPGGLGGPGQRQTIEHVASLMPYVVGRKVRPPDGTIVVWEIDGSPPRTVTVGVEGGRGSLLDEVPSQPTVVLRLDDTTFWRLGCGRTPPPDGAEVVSSEGPPDLAHRILTEMNFMI